ncbi:MAG: hypothetical protein IKA17_05465 [Clostridia bacterium]|nr:hypothetical protein [Clostridia bacterium]
MKRLIKKDPFFENQPPLAFVDELKKPLHSEKPAGYGEREIEKNEIDARGLYLAELFCDDPDGLLETIYNDFNKFIKIYEIGGNRFPIFLKKEETDCFEAYKINISDDNITISANDTEGIRRGLIYLEDELRRRENAFLLPGETYRKPKIHTRITRCFFSPINRPPKNGDELSDNIDYYPDEYLNRIMHDGANGVWIYTHFSDLIPSSIIKEYGNGYEARIAKLNRVIDKCAKYGIGVYLFAIEPFSLSPEELEKYPFLAGDIFEFNCGGGKKARGATVCPNSEEVKKFCYELGYKLLELAPKLTGFLDITAGERYSHCANGPSKHPVIHPIVRPCPRCSQEKKGHVLSSAVEAICSGFRAKNPDFKVISWTYGHASWDINDVVDYVKTAPADAMLMQNFEDGGYGEQLGKLRRCIDYWLSYIGPSEMFETTAKQALESNKHMFAKMQVCCSHEIASVPYVPVPGILFKKYSRACALNVEGIVQCWYFGNYPSLMSKAAGELAFMNGGDNEYDFLKSLAGIYWGNSKAESVARAWKEFESAYTHYPMTIMFSYYGPMHDSVVWKLALKPKNFSLPRTWQTADPSDGDRIGECILNSHSLEEILTLTEEMYKRWEIGTKFLETIDSNGIESKEQKSVASAINLLFKSGHNVIAFYKLREDLGLQKGDARKILEDMKRIVEEEIENSRQMITLWNNDIRLGYHSEGEGYKFFPEKLEDRIEQLSNLLATEFVEVATRIENGLSPLEYYDGIEDNEDLKRYSLLNTNIENATWEVINTVIGSKFRMAYDDSNLYIELQSNEKENFVLTPEFRLLWPDAEIFINPNGTPELTSDGLHFFGLFDEKIAKELGKYQITVLTNKGTHLLVTIRRSDVGLETIRPFKMKITAGETLWCREEKPVYFLGKSKISPGDFGWILP